MSPATAHPGPFRASLAYSSNVETNSYPFILSPVLNLPPSFGSAYVGEAFSCTLCANHDIPDPSQTPAGAGVAPPAKCIRDVRIVAEMKTPTSGAAIKLDLGPESVGDAGRGVGVDLEAGETLQKVVNFDLKEEGNHVLAVTVSYYEATDTSGRTRTFRKLYQFICKASLIVRTKAGELSPRRDGAKRWVLEAQLENCSEDAIQLERVVLDAEPNLTYSNCNWEASASQKPMLHRGEVEQVCFVVEEAAATAAGSGAAREQDGRMIFGVLGIGWRSEMGNRGFLSTGKLGARQIKAR